MPVERGCARAIDVRGASWLTISGFHFTETSGGQVAYREGLDGYGAFMPPKGSLPEYCGEAVHLLDVSHCTVENSHVNAVWGNGVFLEGRCERNVIRGNEFSRVGHTSVLLFGTVDRHPQFNRVEDNHIHDGGAVNKAVAGIYSGVGNGNVYAHNAIHDMPNHAINLGANGYGRNFVEYNDVRRVCLENCDTGAINMWMDRDAFPSAAPIPRDVARCGHIIRFNRIMDVYGCCMHENGVVSHGPENAKRVATLASGVYVDDCSSNCLIYGNVIVRTGSGVMIHGGRNNLVENNIFIDCKYQYTINNEVLTRAGNEQIYDFLAGHRFVRNIFATNDPESYLLAAHYLNSDRNNTTPDTPEQRRARFEQAVGEADRNVYFSPANAEATVEFWNGWPWAAKPVPLPLEEWQALGFDSASLFEDPRFVDPAADDYRLRPDSPALKLGFTPIDLDAIGIREKR